MKQFVLLRHGESEWNRLNLFTGWTDVELSEKGRTEAAEAGRLLAEGGFDFDVCYTSYLKRAIHTLDITLAALDRSWLPVVKDWRLNERHYGALQGLNKAETAAEYGEAQVKIWRRSFDVPPPPLAPNDPRNPAKLPMYRGVDPAALPLSESLADTIRRVMPYFESEILPQVAAGRRVLIAAHGNSLRALVKVLDGLSDEAITNVNIPTGVPLVYELDDALRAVDKRYLGNAAVLAAKMEAVANQGKAKGV